MRALVMCWDTCAWVMRCDEVMCDCVMRALDMCWMSCDCVMRALVMCWTRVRV